MVTLLAKVKYTVVVLVGFLLAVEIVLIVLYFTRTKKTKTQYIKKVLVAAGNTLGYSAVISLALFGVTEAICVVVPILLSASFLLCGGTDFSTFDS
jgi:hypothetical protein